MTTRIRGQAIGSPLEEQTATIEEIVMPSEMEERVAKAICCPHSECRRKFGCTALYENRIQARAAIKAMR